MIRSLFPLPLRRAVALAICPEVAQSAPPVVHVVHINTRDLPQMARQDIDNQRRGNALRRLCLAWVRAHPRPFSAETFATSGLSEKARTAALAAINRVNIDPRAGVTERTLGTCVAAFASVWPEGLAWPEGIDRPAVATVLRLVK